MLELASPTLTKLTMIVEDTAFFTKVNPAFPPSVKTLTAWFPNCQDSFDADRSNFEIESSSSAVFDKMAKIGLRWLEANAAPQLDHFNLTMPYRGGMDLDKCPVLASKLSCAVAAINHLGCLFTVPGVCDTLRNLTVKADVY